LWQIVVNDLKRARISHGRMIWLLARPLPSTSVSVSKLERATHRKTEIERQLAHGKGGKRVGEEPNYTTAKGLVLYKSFNTLCVVACDLLQFYQLVLF
jgi:hypothetical protein